MVSPQWAVCLRPGTEVAFEREVECDHLLASSRTGSSGEKVARFRQVNEDQPNVHHDALEFPDGEVILLTRLCEGQHATVLQLPAVPHPAQEAEEQKRASFIA